MIRELQKEAYETAKRNGYEVDCEVLEQLKGISGEVIEATASYTHGYKSDFLESELADIIIRTMTLAEHLDIDLEQAILDKMKLNKERVDRGNN